MEQCEIRLPTYKRPQLLKRALESLLAQSYPHWVAIVMDDSPQQEGKYIVESLHDNRIQYVPNPQNLGCAGNINQAFTSHSLRGGQYACILEDDNWLMPEFLIENIQVLKTHQVYLMLRNQVIWLQTERESIPTDRTTRGELLTEKIHTPLSLKAHLFYCEGISNGGLFWRTDLTSNLQVDNSVIDAGLQEYCRTLQVSDSLYFAVKPLCYWSEMTAELSLRNAVENRIFGRGVQSIKMHLLKRYSDTLVKEASQIGDRLNRRAFFEYSLLDSLYQDYHFEALSLKQKVQQYLKSYVKFKLVQDPLSDYFASKL